MSWYAVHTEPRSEFAVHDAVSALGFRSFLPSYTKTIQDRRRHAKPPVDVQAPLFPGYVFAEFDRADETWGAIKRLAGVRELLWHSDNPTPILGAFIDQVTAELVAIEAARHADKAIRLSPIPKGARIEIVDGPFATYGGIVIKSARDRVRIMLNVIGRTVIDSPRSYVAALT